MIQSKSDPRRQTGEIPEFTYRWPPFQIGPNPVDKTAWNLPEAYCSSLVDTCPPSCPLLWSKQELIIRAIELFSKCQFQINTKTNHRGLGVSPFSIYTWLLRVQVGCTWKCQVEFFYETAHDFWEHRSGLNWYLIIQMQHSEKSWVKSQLCRRQSTIYETSTKHTRDVFLQINSDENLHSKALLKSLRPWKTKGITQRVYFRVGQLDLVRFKKIIRFFQPWSHSFSHKLNTWVRDANNSRLLKIW